MANVHTPQRRALEALKPKQKDIFDFSQQDEFVLSGKRIYLLGISEGIGTCSDLHGINIAVLGWIQPESIRMPMQSQNKKITCSWSALLREPTEEEFQNELKGKKGIAYLVVELIEPILLIEKDDGKRIYYFKSTTKKEFYVNTIC